MSCHRAILVGVGLVAAAAQAEPSAHERTGVWRKLPISRAPDGSEVVPELWVAPGSATLLHLPSPILPGGFTVSGGQARVDVQQVTPNTLVIVPATEIGPERIPLAVATADQHRYPFLMVTRPGMVDLEVSVVLDEPRRPEASTRRPEADIFEALLEHKQVVSRQYEQPVRRLEGDVGEFWETPHVETAVRVGDRYFIQIVNRSAEPWKVQQAKLEGALGALRVVEVRWQTTKEGQNCNVVLARVPEGAGADYLLKAIELVGEDARVARVEREVRLP